MGGCLSGPEAPTPRPSRGGAQRAHSCPGHPPRLSSGLLAPMVLPGCFIQHTARVQDWMWPSLTLTPLSTPQISQPVYPQILPSSPSDLPSQVSRRHITVCLPGMCAPLSQAWPTMALQDVEFHFYKFQFDSFQLFPFVLKLEGRRTECWLSCYYPNALNPFKLSPVLCLVLLVNSVPCLTC